VAFVLAPRINAAGRLGNAEQGLRLLLARDPGEAEAIARSLEDDNNRRRQMDEQVLIEAEGMVKGLGYPDCSSILLWSDKWHPGVIGIVASRLVERFQRPTVLVALKDGRGRGSGRSLPGIDLTRLLDGCDDLLLAHGGHAFAAGLSVTPEHLPDCASASSASCVRRRSRTSSCSSSNSMPTCGQASATWNWWSGSSGWRRTGSTIPNRCSA
jgi:single-stranded-DNA-specific exonuclease